LSVEIAPDKPSGGIYLLIISENGKPVYTRKIIRQ